MDRCISQTIWHHIVLAAYPAYARAQAALSGLHDTLPPLPQLELPEVSMPPFLNMNAPGLDLHALASDTKQRVRLSAQQLEAMTASVSDSVASRIPLPWTTRRPWNALPSVVTWTVKLDRNHAQRQLQARLLHHLTQAADRLSRLDQPDLLASLSRSAEGITSAAAGVTAHPLSRANLPLALQTQNARTQWRALPSVVTWASGVTCNLSTQGALQAQLSEAWTHTESAAEGLVARVSG